MEEVKITTKEFCDTLREVGEKLASGEREEVVIPKAYIEIRVEGGSKISPSYMRTTINRVAAVKATGGCASVKVKTNEEGAKAYHITINRAHKRKVITADELPSLEQRWKRKFIEHLLKLQPRITDLEGDELKGAAIGIERFIAMIEDMAKGDE